MLRVTDLVTDLDTEGALVRAVDGVSLAIERGETFALVGESGCGKSMTALSILRLLPDNGRVAEGAIHVGDVDVVQLPEAQMRDVRGRRVSIIFQEPATYGHQRHEDDTRQGAGLPQRLRQPLVAPQRLNEIWALDFMADALYGWRPFRTVNVIDEGSREALDIEIATSIPARRVIRVMEGPIELYGKPLALRLDNGSELTSTTFTGSPIGYSKIRLEAPLGTDLDGKGNNFIESPNLVISGDIPVNTAVPLPLSVDRVTCSFFGTTEHIDVFLTTKTGATTELRLSYLRYSENHLRVRPKTIPDDSPGDVLKRCPPLPLPSSRPFCK